MTPKDALPGEHEPLHLESFAAMHEGLQSHFLVHAGRAALGRHHRSPIPLHIHGTAIREQTRVLHFQPPDPRHERTFQRARVVEDGAVVMAGLVLSLDERRILRVTRRGSRVDYFFGSAKAKTTLGVVEISGTDEGSIEARCRDKLDQARQSPYLGRMSVLVAVTRFIDPSCRLEHVTKGAST